jgi:hypothetical protein
MTFRDDSEALRARVDALERELEDERKQRQAAIAEVESERERRQEEVQAARKGLEKRTAWLLFVALIGLGALTGAAAALGYDEMGRLHRLAVTRPELDTLRRHHRLCLETWVADVAAAAACGLAIVLVLGRARRRAWTALVIGAGAGAMALIEGVNQTHGAITAHLWLPRLFVGLAVVSAAWLLRRDEA